MTRVHESAEETPFGVPVAAAAATIKPQSTRKAKKLRRLVRAINQAIVNNAVFAEHSQQEKVNFRSIYPAQYKSVWPESSESASISAG